MSDPRAKAAHIKQKTDEMRRLFNLPETETVIQDYACTDRNSTLIAAGRLYISQNYMGFYCGVPEITHSIPYRKVTDVQKDFTAILFNNGITVLAGNDTYNFGSFGHRDETFNLLVYLWKNPPSYVEVDDAIHPDPTAPPPMSPNLPPASSLTNKSSGQSGGGASGGATGTSPNNPFSADGGAGSTNSYGVNRNQPSGLQGQGSNQTMVKVDTQTSKEALRTVREARDIGAATMNELSYQAEVIDLIERDVENVHNGLDKADRLVRGIESFGGTMANAFSKEKQTGKKIDYVDRTLTSTRVDVPVDVQILWKLNNDDLVPAILRFTADKFFCINPTPNKRAEKDISHPYDAIELIVLRARHLHLDVRFKGKKDLRFRCMSSYVQSIVNEFYIRYKAKINAKLNVMFEPGAKQFSYGSNSISVPSSSDSASRSKAGFFRKENAPTSAFARNAPEEIRGDLMQQEQDLNDISDVLGDLHGMATTMGSELDRQTEQLDRITGRVDSAQGRMDKTNRRINNML